MKMKFHFRSFTALIMLWSFLVEIVTGIVLYVVPSGRIANWTNWKLWGITKQGWGALHTIFGYLFFIFACFHIIYNWNAILNYLRRKIKKGLKMRLELGTSLLLSVLFTAATLINLAPFSTVMDFGEKMKNSWEESKNPPIRLHAEDMTLHELTTVMEMEPADAAKIITDASFYIQSPEQTIKSIAEENGISPADIYDLLIKKASPEARQKLEKKPSPQSHKPEKGYGQMPLTQIARDAGLTTDEVLALLKAHGITAHENDTIRTIADKNNKKPFEIADMIKENK